ncbi:hypothetical protein LTR56_007617 [Elasticomyces elasticus]|nr:hypothetical protein LTR56_007617 [Elasticomyces elasticus]KAK3665318.1 hypothetical protein LTR22_003840 [Elasticomyces elasticus]KAK4929709.1 hypothetical protein LTR49_003667 [Elasticomyces elasticus]KAK5761071.1 hypothetical protein LTS12_008748 [Elasticomyces elasticus]
MDDDPDWLEFQACSRRSRQIIHELHSRRSGLQYMPIEEPKRAYTANKASDAAIWEAMRDAEIARRDAEYDLMLPDSEDEPTMANSATRPAALPPTQPSTIANPSTLPTVNVPTKSGFSRIGSPRLLCRCSCGCSQSYYERKRGTNFQCGPCIKGKRSRCAEPLQAGALSVSSQQGGSSSASAPQPPTTQSTSSAPTLPTLASTNLTGPHSGQPMVDSVLQPRNAPNFDGAEGDAGQQVVSRTAVDRHGRDTSAEKAGAVVAQEMKTDSSTAEAAAGGQSQTMSCKSIKKRSMPDDGDSHGAALSTSWKRVRASESEGESEGRGGGGGEGEVWRDRWIPAGPLQLRWGGLRD